jgi:hypothetical protein
MLSFFKLLLGSPFKIIGDVITNKQNNKANAIATEAAIQVQRISNIEAGRISEVQWNLKSMDNGAFRANWMTILLSIPLVLVFGPDSIQQQIADGFVELQKLPGWYISAVGLMIGSAFGYQKYTDFVMNRAYKMPSLAGDSK